MRTRRLTWMTRNRLVTAVLAVLCGCNGGESLTGAGGSIGKTGVGGHLGGPSGMGGASANGGSGSGGDSSGSGGSGAAGGSSASGGSSALGGSSASGGSSAGGTSAGGGSGATGQLGGSSGSGGAGGTGPGVFGNNVDILFMIDDASGATVIQQKLLPLLPQFIAELTSASTQPSLHIGIVSSDLGAPGDSTSSIMCTTSGDQGWLQSMPRSNSTLNPPITCTSNTLTPPPNQADSDHTYISDANGMPNYTDPLGSVLQCITPLGGSGCGFVQPLASIDRALGADGMGPPPSTNTGFLRANAYLAIVLLSDRDDCSAPLNTQVYSLKVGGSNQQNIANALGPIALYRCNEFGNLCRDPASPNPNALIEPPLNPPADAQGTAAAPTLDLADCESNDDTTGLLTPVSKFVSDIRALKPDPDNQIVVAAIAGPAAPYTVAWLPEQTGQNTQPGELWPEVLESCGHKGDPNVNPDPSTQYTTDSSSGLPGVRLAQFVSAFPKGVLGSVCDPDYSKVLNQVATEIVELLPPL